MPLVNIGGVRVRAVCDIWKYSQNYGQKFLARHGQEVQVYEDYREMLDKEQELDAVLVATPDFAHAAQTNACLEAGLHVYCEPMLAHNLPAARSMVETMRRTGKLLQVGYQRRSNPRYRHVLEKLLAEARLPGRLTAVQTQWAQEAADLRGWPKRFTMPDDVLHRYGYDDMSQFRNWIWYPQVLRRTVLCVRVPATRRLPVVPQLVAAHRDGQRRQGLLPGPSQPGHGHVGVRVPARTRTGPRVVHHADVDQRRWHAALRAIPRHRGFDPDVGEPALDERRSRTQRTGLGQLGRQELPGQAGRRGGARGTRRGHRTCT